MDGKSPLIIVDASVLRWISTSPANWDTAEALWWSFKDRPPLKCWWILDVRGQNEPPGTMNIMNSSEPPGRFVFYFYSFWVTHQKFLVKPPFKPPFKPPLNHGSSWWKHHFWSLKKSHILPMGFSHAFPRWLQRSLNWRQHGGTIEGWRYQQFGLVLLGKFTLW